MPKNHQIKLAVFDLDGTLSPVGKGMLPSTVDLLRKLEDAGIRIAVCSGKTAYYLCGYVRQIGLKQPILAGENGAVIQFGVELPPRQFYHLPYGEDAKASKKMIRAFLDAEFPDMWYQPNEVMLTPFPKNGEEMEKIAAFLEEHKHELHGVEIYRFDDCFDIVPKGISKRKGMEFLAGLLGLQPSQIAAVGDGANDIPMLQFAGCSLGVGAMDPSIVDCSCSTIDDAIRILLDEAK